jgi:hypothetical protein
MQGCLAMVLMVFIMVPFQAKEPDPRTLAQTSLKLAIISQDGKRLGDKLAAYAIFKVDNKWDVVWDEVNFGSSAVGGNPKEVTLDMMHYSTADGTIKNVEVADDFASFDIEPAAPEKISIHVTCRPPKEYLLTPDVRAVAVYPKHTYEWTLTERILLPSTEVFGNPLPGEKH